MKLLKYFSLIMFMVFFSCKEKKTNNKEIKKKEFNNFTKITFKSINHHSFIELTKTDSINIFYKPCDASILKYKILDDTLFIRTNQDGNFKCRIREIKKINDNTLNLKYKYDDYSPLIDLNFVKKKKNWKINNRLFIDSLLSKNIPYIKQSCKDFFK